MKKTNWGKRWLPDTATRGLEVLTTGADGPFGQTEDGLVDMRGLAFGAERVDRRQVDGIDLSYAEVGQFIISDTWVANSLFERMKGKMIVGRSDFSRVSFDRSVLRGSGLSTNNTRYDQCSFVRTNFSGGSCVGAEFNQCRFEQAQLNGQYERVKFVDCVFRGTLKSLLLRNTVFERCDLRDAVFENCTFYGVQWNECQLAEDAMLFEKWQEVVIEFLACASHHPEERARTDIMIWGEVAQQSSQQSYLIDQGILRRRNGEVIRSILRRIYDSRRAPLAR